MLQTLINHSVVMCPLDHLLFGGQLRVHNGMTFESSFVSNPPPHMHTHAHTHTHSHTETPSPLCHTLAQVASLGDSGMRVVRGGSVVFATSVQQHQFNMPYQLACPSMLPDTDTAADAQVSQVLYWPGVRGSLVISNCICGCTRAPDVVSCLCLWCSEWVVGMAIEWHSSFNVLYNYTGKSI